MKDKLFGGRVEEDKDKMKPLTIGENLYFFGIGAVVFVVLYVVFKVVV